VEELNGNLFHFTPKFQYLHTYFIIKKVPDIYKLQLSFYNNNNNNNNNNNL
jgi:hypothetical protein